MKARYYRRLNVTRDKTRSSSLSWRDDTSGSGSPCSPHFDKMKTTTSAALTVEPHTVLRRRNQEVIPRRAFSTNAARSESSPGPNANDARFSARAAAPSCRNSLSRSPVAADWVLPVAEGPTAPAASGIGGVSGRFLSGVKGPPVNFSARYKKQKKGRTERALETEKRVTTSCRTTSKR